MMTTTRSPITVLPLQIFALYFRLLFFLYSFPPIQLLQGLGLNLPAGAETDQHTGSAIAVYLVLHGANVSFYNHEGKTPLDLCQDTQTAALIQQFARTAPRWVACVAGFCKQYGLKKERGARGGHARSEVLSRAPSIFARILLTSAGYEVGKFAFTLCHFTSSIISHTRWGFC